MDSVSSADQNVTYTVTVTCMNDTVVAGQSVAYPDSSLKIPGLPACTTCTFLRATLAAERNNESSNCNLILPFSTFESSGESYLSKFESDTNVLMDASAFSVFSFTCICDVLQYAISSLAS